MGTSYEVTDYHFKKLPNPAVLVEMALTQHRLRVRSELNHVRSENNQWSDQLAPRDYSVFNRDLEIEIRADTMSSRSSLHSKHSVDCSELRRL